MLLYPQHLTEREVLVLAKLYKVEQNLKSINKFQSTISPVLHDTGKANDHADSWREIESAMKLIKIAITEIKY